eukprot:1155186-Pelagomonas_calceolata.AAC.2
MSLQSSKHEGCSLRCLSFTPSTRGDCTNQTFHIHLTCPACLMLAFASSAPLHKFCAALTLSWTPPSLMVAQPGSVPSSEPMAGAGGGTKGLHEKPQGAQRSGRTMMGAWQRPRTQDRHLCSE